MIHAKENDFDVVKDIFYQHKEWFPHIRTDYMRRMIASGNLILDNDVIITYNYYKRNYKLVKSSMGEMSQKIIMQPNDCILHQIAAKNRNGSASEALQRFFKWTNRRVFLSVRSDNVIAKAFYERNDMKLIGKTSWTKDGVKNALPGDIYLYDNVEEVL
jgi:RimJ/RimL family protein N-acetyltransferase|tara:strand:- start:69 stop:545 length:477 start_codon:yes stop_codon:yes gene_type:complete